MHNKSTSAPRTFITLITFVLVTALTGCAGNSVNYATVTTGTQFAVDTNQQSPVLYMDLQGILWQLPKNGGAATALSGISDDIRKMRVSPDGTAIAFESFARGYWDIVVAQLDSQNARISNRRSLTMGPHDHREPEWSADSNTLFFSADRSGNYDIWAVNIASGTLTEITRDPAEDYSPTVAGNTLIFISDRERTPAIYSLNLGTTDVAEKIATAPAGILHPPRLSQNGRHVAYVQAIKRNGFPSVAINQLVLRDQVTQTTRILSGDDSDVFSMPPAWLDDDTLIYTADGKIIQLDLAATNPANATVIPFSAALPLRTDDYDKRTPFALTLTPDTDYPALGIVDPVMLPNDAIVFSALGDLWQQNTDGTVTQLTNDQYVERDVDVSPDGSSLAYISDREINGERRMQIWRRDLSNGEDRQLSDDSSGPRYPTFSPDGKRIAYLQVGPRGTQDFTLRILDLATGKSQRLRSSPQIWPGRIAWSADGTHVTVAELATASTRNSSGTNRLVRIDVINDTASTENLNGLIPDFGPVASHDYRQLALIIDGALWRVAVATVGKITGTPTLVLDELVESPAWSWQNDAIAVLSNTGLEVIEVGNGQRSDRNPPLTWQVASGKKQQLIHAGRVWDGVSDDYQLNMDILVKGDRIISVAPHTVHPDGISVTDANHQTVIPGLIDHHVHFEGHKGVEIGEQLLAFGITTVVEPGGLPYESREQMEAWSSGKRPGPRLVYAGPQLDGARKVFAFATHVNSEQRLQQELERGARLNYGLIKTYTTLTPTLQARAVDLAHAQGLPVTAHAALRNLGNGGDRIEHLRGSSRLSSSAKQSDLLKSYADLEAIVTQSGSSVTPTIVNQGAYFSYTLAHPEVLETAQYKTLYAAPYRNNLAAFTKVVGRKSALINKGVRNAQKTINTLHDQGAQIVAGTDSPIFPYGLSLVIELSSYVDGGLTPAEALRTATSDAAVELAASDRMGTIAPGYAADLLIIDGDPLSEISDLRHVRGVMLNGRWIPPTAQPANPTNSLVTEIQLSAP